MAEVPQFHLRSDVVRSAHSGVCQPSPPAPPTLSLVPGQTVRIPDDLDPGLLLLLFRTLGPRLGDQVLVVLSAVRLLHSCAEAEVCQLDVTSGV